METITLLDIPKTNIEKLPSEGQNIIIWYDTIEKIHIRTPPPLNEWVYPELFTTEVQTTKQIIFNTSTRDLYLVIFAEEGLLYYKFKTNLE